MNSAALLAPFADKTASKELIQSMFYEDEANENNKYLFL